MAAKTTSTSEAINPVWGETINGASTCGPLALLKRSKLKPKTKASRNDGNEQQQQRKKGDSAQLGQKTWLSTHCAVRRTVSNAPTAARERETRPLFHRQEEEEDRGGRNRMRRNSADGGTEARAG